MFPLLRYLVCSLLSGGHCNCIGEPRLHGTCSCLVRLAIESIRICPSCLATAGMNALFIQMPAAPLCRSQGRPVRTTQNCCSSPTASRWTTSMTNSASSSAKSASPNTGDNLPKKTWESRTLLRRVACWKMPKQGRALQETRFLARSRFS